MKKSFFVGSAVIALLVSCGQNPAPDPRVSAPVVVGNTTFDDTDGLINATYSVSNPAELGFTLEDVTTSGASSRIQLQAANSSSRKGWDGTVKGTAYAKATSGLKDTLKTQVRLAPTGNGNSNTLEVDWSIDRTLETESTDDSPNSSMNLQLCQVDAQEKQIAPSCIPIIIKKYKWDVGVKKTVTSPPVVGGNAQFTLNFSANTGPASILAGQLVVDDPIQNPPFGLITPAVLAAINTANPAWTCAVVPVNTLRCKNNGVIPMGSAPAPLVISVPVIAAGNYVNCAYIRSFDLLLSNNKHCVDGTVKPQTDLKPVVGIAKQLVSVVNLGSGTGEMTFRFKVQNYSNPSTAISNLQIVENLSAVFGAMFFTVPGGTPTLVSSSGGASIAFNPLFNGSSDTNLLNAPSSSLAALGDNAVIELKVRFRGDPCKGDLRNGVTASGGILGTNLTTTDQSVNGTNPDPDSDGNPNNNQGFTPIPYDICPQQQPNPVIGAAKYATPIVNAGGGFATVSFFLIAENYSNPTVGLINVQIVENLSTTFGSMPFSVTGTSIASQTNGASVTLNSAFDGSTDTNVLTNPSVLPNGGVSSSTRSKAVVKLDVRFRYDKCQGTLNNSIVASGQVPNAAGGVVTVSDESAGSDNPDPDGDGNPNNNASPTTVSWNFCNQP